MGKLLRAVDGLHYVSADLSVAADVRLDVTALPFADRSFDAVVCNHVLEHVDDDRAAMNEFRRVLRPDGWAILQSPLDPSRPITYEDPSVKEPADRERLFGQFDHVRLYGRDYYDRLDAAGFDVEAVPFAEQLGPEAVAQHALRREAIVLCRPVRGA
jgi:SAM-dependent methyltransferase